MKNKSSRRYEECFRHVHAMSALHERSPAHMVFFPTTGTNSMHFTAWMLEDWVCDYKRYGIIPEISINWKIANRFSYLLMCINVRSQSGQVCTFCMEFIPTKTEDSFTWMLQNFMSVVPVSSGMAFIGQNAALIAAVKKALPNRLLCLDEWHLNKNQVKNVTEWYATISRSSFCEDMNSYLYSIPGSNSLKKLDQRRKNFEWKYFLAFNRHLPRWYSFLYRQNTSFVVTLYKKLSMPITFLFQGTGYSESANSMFWHRILRRRIPIFDVSEEMSELTKWR